MFFRTDMALEKANHFPHIPDGVHVEKFEGEEQVEITRVVVKTNQAALEMEKPMGTYITIESPDLSFGEAEVNRQLSRVFARELRKLMGKIDGTVMVVGVGNRAVTADSLGPMVAEKILVTRHLLQTMKEILPEHACSACALAPGVLGDTGMETGEILAALVKEIQPALILAVDSLAAQASWRIARSVQLTDSGLAPGSGIGNDRKILNKEELGVPVIGIGVPMVVYASSIAYESAKIAMHEENLPQEIQERLLSLLNASAGDLVVAPKEIDYVVKNCAEIISSGINMALHQITYERAEQVLS